eukprot:gene36480-49135_t
MNVFDSFDFRDLFRAGILRYTDEGDKDDNMIYLHILDCIGALSSIQKRRENIHLKTKKQNTNDQVAESNRRIFWQVVRELADKELPLADRKVSTSSEINWAQYRVLDVFPDEAKRLDGRSWLPLHWAMSLPITDIQDIENLIIAKPERLNILTTEFGLNPIHLACLTNGRVDVVHLLMDHLPLDERCVTSSHDGSTPLHLAVRSSSNSLAFVRELVRLYPSALEMGDSEKNTPLHCVSAVSSEGPQILQALLDAAPQTAQKRNCLGELPLHHLIKSSPPVSPEMIATLLAAYPDAVNIRDRSGCLPIHIAVKYASVQIFQMIAEENMVNLTVMTDEPISLRRSASVAHIAVQFQKLDI